MTKNRLSLNWILIRDTLYDHFTSDIRFTTKNNELKRYRLDNILFHIIESNHCDTVRVPRPKAGSCLKDLFVLIFMCSIKLIK